VHCASVSIVNRRDKQHTLLAACVYPFGHFVAFFFQRTDCVRYLVTTDALSTWLRGAFVIRC
jgi:hypothetical protein